MAPHPSVSWRSGYRRRWGRESNPMSTTRGIEFVTSFQIFLSSSWRETIESPNRHMKSMILCMSQDEWKHCFSFRGRCWYWRWTYWFLILVRTQIVLLQARRCIFGYRIQRDTHTLRSHALLGASCVFMQLWTFSWGVLHPFKALYTWSPFSQ